MTADKKIIFIGGMGRSGSTLLGELLGQMDDWAALGEVRYFWDRAVLEDSHCACQRPLSQCRVWGELVRKYARGSVPEIENMVQVRNALRSRDCWRAVLGVGREVLEEKTLEYVDQLQTLYSEISEVMDGWSFVDSSKFPSHGYALDRLDGFQVYMVHLVRDPRAVAFSWKKKKVYEKKDDQLIYIRRLGIVRSTLYWMSWNLLLERLWHREEPRRSYRLVRYEDFVRAPEKTIREIAEWIDGPVALPFIDHNRAELHGGHTLSGNPSRFKTGDIKIEEDDRWKKDMPRNQVAMVTAMAWPLMRHYGYELRWVERDR